MQFKSNNGMLAGELIDGFSFSHSHLGEDFYKGTLRVERHSGISDYIRLIVQKSVLDKCDITEKFIEVSGNVRSKKIDGIPTAFFFVNNVINVEEGTFVNMVSIEGEIFKSSTIRLTPKGYKLIDIEMKVSRAYATDFIWTLFWGRKALEVSRLSAGQVLRINGRLQSRTFRQVYDGREVERYKLEISTEDYEVIQVEGSND